MFIVKRRLVPALQWAARCLATALEASDTRMHVVRMLALNNAHLPRRELDLLDDAEMPVYAVAHDAGFFVYVGDADPEPTVAYTHPMLVSLFERAREHNCRWLCLDRDGEIVKGLPLFDYDAAEPPAVLWMRSTPGVVD